MDHFDYRDGELHAEDVPLRRIAQQHGTPCFVYSRATLERHYRAFDDALAGLPHRVCYAVKANSNLAVLDVLARLGSSFDIVSGGELARLQALDVPGDRIVFSGVGKSRPEIEAGARAPRAGAECGVAGRTGARGRGGRDAGVCRRRCRCASTRTSMRRPTPISPPV